MLEYIFGRDILVKKNTWGKLIFAICGQAPLLCVPSLLNS